MLKIILNTYNKRSKKFHIVMQENFEFMFLLNFIFNKFINLNKKNLIQINKNQINYKYN